MTFAGRGSGFSSTASGAQTTVASGAALSAVAATSRQSGRANSSDRSAAGNASQSLAEDAGPPDPAARDTPAHVAPSGVATVASRILAPFRSLYSDNFTVVTYS